MFALFRLFLPITILITLAALAFAAYVAIDEDLRTLVWSKWQGDVAYEFPGGGRHIQIEVGID